MTCRAANHEDMGFEHGSTREREDLARGHKRECQEYCPGRNGESEGSGRSESCCVEPK